MGVPSAAPDGTVTVPVNVGDATGLRGSTTAGSLYISLHTADPGETGSQTTSEIAYTNYARVAVARSGAGFTVSGNTTTNAADVSFPACGVTGATITSACTTTAASGSTPLWHYGDLNAPIAVSNQIQPRFPIGAVTITEA